MILTHIILPCQIFWKIPNTKQKNSEIARRHKEEIRKLLDCLYENFVSFEVNFQYSHQLNDITCKHFFQLETDTPRPVYEFCIPPDIESLFDLETFVFLNMEIRKIFEFHC